MLLVCFLSHLATTQVVREVAQLYAATRLRTVVVYGTNEVLCPQRAADELLWTLLENTGTQSLLVPLLSVANAELNNTGRALRIPSVPCTAPPLGMV